MTPQTANSQTPGLIHRIRHEANYRLSSASTAIHNGLRYQRKRRSMRRWLKQLRSKPPQVLLGANFDAGRGIRNHLLGIQTHSKMTVELAPPDYLRDRLEYPDFHTDLREVFFDFDPSGIANLHSHVYPFFIEWCNASSGRSSQWIHTYHSPYFPTSDTGVLEPWEQQINFTLVQVARNADVRVSVSRWQQAWLASQHRISSVYIPNGVDVSVCEGAEASRFRSPFGSRRFVVFVGGNEAVKNPGDFVRVARSMPDIGFLVIGAGLSAQSIELAHGVQSPGNVVYTGYLPRINVQDAMAASHALVMTSLWEGLPTVVLEAMVHGLPVVVPDNAGCMEAVDNGRYGFVYAQGDLEALATGIRNALSAGRSSVARERVLAEYDWRVVSRQLDEVYGRARM